MAIFRPPTDNFVRPTLAENFTKGLVLSKEQRLANRLAAHVRPTARGRNVFLLTNGNYTENEPSDMDPYMSGRYLITTVRHSIDLKMKKHIMTLECMKDSVRRPYPEETNDTFIGKEKNNEGIIDIYKLDEIYSNQAGGYFKG